MTSEDPAEKESRTKDPDAPLIVGIGASAGGLEALQRFFDGMPPDGDGIAFVVVMHLDPKRESALPEILQRNTSLTVTQVKKRTRIQDRHIYVIPPNKSLEVVDGHLDLSDLEEPRWARAPIDLFFRSLSRSHDGCVAVVLSGSGSDGSVGLKTVKELGGLVAAQHPSDAQHDSMPRAALATGLCDIVGSAGDLARSISAYAQNRRRIQVGDVENLDKDETEVLRKILARLRALTGHDFSGYKRSTVLRRVGRRMQVRQTERLAEYLSILRDDRGEADALKQYLLISVTHFFRDPEVWEGIADDLVPRLLQGDPKSLRIWVPGCASGEEAYSLAIVLIEAAAKCECLPDIQIFASDMDSEAIARARHGSYPEAIAADVSEERLQRFFTKEGELYKIRKEVRERVLFAVHSLLKDPPFSDLDLISCRNVLIYVNRELQQDIFRLFHYGLKEGGYLVLGNAESTEKDGGLFRVVDKKHRFYRREDSQSAPRLPAKHPSGVEGAAAGGVTQRTATIDSTPEVARHLRLLQESFPPSIVVSAGGRLLHLSDRAGDYLSRPGGEPTNDVLEEVRPELRPELQVALNRAFESGQSSGTRAIAVKFDGHTRWVHILVRPSPERERALVIFAEVEAPGLSAEPEDDDPGRTEPGGRDREQEAEIRNLRERLQTLIEEYEASREEMKASNEELQSINEEHKSTAEELETSKEELQSINEELETVNQELNAKVQELGRANSDLQNLMSSTEIGTLFLDRDLNIQRYTPRVEELFNIMPGDRGRPILHLTKKIDYESLEPDARSVLQDLHMVERRIPGQDGKHFLVRLRPYRTLDDHIEGVVVTFVDITEMQAAEDALAAAKQYAEAIVDTVRSGLLVLDRDLRVVSANKPFYTMFGVTADRTEGRRIFDLGDRQWDLPRLREMLEDIMERETVLRDFEMEYDSDETGRRTMSLNARKLEDRQQVLLSIEDVTERKHFAVAMAMTEQAERRRLSQLVHDEIQQLLFSVQVKVDRAGRQARKEGAESYLEDLDKASAGIHRAMEVAREITVDLSPPVLKEEGLHEALLWLARQMDSLHGLEVKVEADHSFRFEDVDVQVLVFQVVRELLFNTFKHSGVDEALVTLEENAGFVVCVSDGGEGFDLEEVKAKRSAGESYGLFSAVERIRLLGGEMKIDTAEGKGTRITLHLPPSVRIARG